MRVVAFLAKKIHTNAQNSRQASRRQRHRLAHHLSLAMILVINHLQCHPSNHLENPLHPHQSSHLLNRHHFHPPNPVPNPPPNHLLDHQSRNLQCHPANHLTNPLPVHLFSHLFNQHHFHPPSPAHNPLPNHRFDHQSRYLQCHPANHPANLLRSPLASHPICPAAPHGPHLNIFLHHNHRLSPLVSLQISFLDNHLVSLLHSHLANLLLNYLSILLANHLVNRRSSPPLLLVPAQACGLHQVLALIQQLFPAVLHHLCQVKWPQMALAQILVKDPRSFRVNNHLVFHL
mmetsp:Transcript_12517/g.27155  ORF Transcript_12517/g.27155 Transcript_12517/m.27155 type:complete len:289 (-) Transcript_12517:1412-2278(-)